MIGMRFGDGNVLFVFVANFEEGGGLVWGDIMLLLLTADIGLMELT